MAKFKRTRLHKLEKLVDQRTRAEIMARLGPLETSEAVDYFEIKMKKDEEILELLYGTSSHVELGLEWGILKPRKSKRKKKNG